MNRSDFLKKLGIGIGVAAISPRLLAEKEENSIGRERNYYSIDEQGLHTEKSLRYYYYMPKSSFPMFNVVLPKDKEGDLVVGDIILLQYESTSKYAEIVGIGRDYYIVTEAYPLIDDAL